MGGDEFGAIDALLDGVGAGNGALLDGDAWDVRRLGREVIPPLPPLRQLRQQVNVRAVANRYCG